MYSSEALPEDEKRALSEKKMGRQERKEKTRNPSESTTLSSTDEPEAVSSAFLSALKCMDGYDGNDDEKPKATPKVNIAPFVVAEATDDIETGSRLSKEAASEFPSSKPRKTTNVDFFRSNFDGNERPSTGAMIAATAPPALQAPVPAHHGNHGDEDEQSYAGAMLAASAVDIRGLQLERDEHALVAHNDILESSMPPILTDGETQTSRDTLHVEGLGLPTESDETFDLHASSSQSQQPARVPAHHGDGGGFLVEATRVTEAPDTSTGTLLVAAEPLQMRAFWHESKSQCGGALTILIIVIVVAIAVREHHDGTSNFSPASRKLKFPPSILVILLRITNSLVNAPPE
jgi:hypothetical protein